MSEEKVTTRLPLKTILISILLFILGAISWRIFDIFVDEINISKMISFNIFGSLLIIFNWSLLKIHKERINELNEKYLFFFIDLILIGLLSWLAKSFLDCDLLIPDGLVLKSYGYARIGMLIAFSFIKAFFINISFKCMTDHFDIPNKELQVILISSIIFGLIMTIGFSDLSLSLLARTYLYNLLLTAIMSYSYNQTSSILPGSFALTLVHIIIMLLSII